jgi:hypothetical protein
MSSFRTLALGAALSTVIAAGASASTVTLDYTGQEPGGMNVSYRFDGDNASARAGQFEFDIVGSGGQTLLAFCVDLAHVLVQSATTYTEHPGLLSSNATLLLDRLFTSFYGSVDTAVESAAFQVAIWEMITDSDNLNLYGGDFKLRGDNNGSLKSQAEYYLANLGEETGGYVLTFLKSTAHPKSQNLVTASVPEVPLPAAGVLLLAGLGGLAAMKRRRKI